MGKSRPSNGDWDGMTEKNATLKANDVYARRKKKKRKLELMQPNSSPVNTSRSFLDIHQSKYAPHNKKKAAPGQDG